MEDNIYELDLQIDESALDLEWLAQPTLMLKYTKYAAKARKEVDRMKELVAVVKAELDKDIRSNPEKYGVEKITEAVVQNQILLAKKYKDVMTELIDAQYEYQMLQGAVQAVEHRKQALENMSRLLGLQYFAGPKMPRDITYEMQQAEKKKQSNETIKIRRRKS